MRTYPGGEFLHFNDGLGTEENPGEIVVEYHKTAVMFKTETYGENAVHSHINYHKIAAFYIRSFLKFKPFVLDKPKCLKEGEISLYVKLANEYFIIAFLEAIFRAWNNDFNGLLSLDPVYKDTFIKHLFRYGKNINLLDPITLADVISFIEQKYFYRSI
jgi:hypothetical protein